MARNPVCDVFQACPSELQRLYLESFMGESSLLIPDLVQCLRRVAKTQASQFSLAPTQDGWPSPGAFIQSSL